MSAQPIQDTADDGLPPWLRELQGGAPASVGYGQSPAAYTQPNGTGNIYQQQVNPQPQPQAGYGQSPYNMQASDLVSPDALPEWLRNIASGPLGAPAGAGNSGPGYSAPAGGAGWAPQAGYGQPSAAAEAQYSPYGGNGMGPVASGPLGSGQLGFGQPASTLFDESALPVWLRQASMGQEIEGAAPTHPAYGMPGGAGAYGAAGAGYAGNQAPPPAQAPIPHNQLSPQDPRAAHAAQASAFPSLDQAGSYRPAPPADAGVSGRSLLDPAALPGWLGGQPGAMPLAANGMPSNPGGISAQSLVDESALPQWLRAEPNTPAAPPASSYGTPATGGIAPTPAAPQRQSNWLSTPAAAEPLPQWLNQVYADANVPRVEPRPAGAPMNSGTPGGLGMGGYGAPNAGMASGNGLSGIGAGTVSASDFVDESALPDWLKSQGATENAFSGAAPAPAPTPGMPARPASGGVPDGTIPEHRVSPMYRPTTGSDDESARRFAASDLIDPSALPSWVTAQNPAPEPTFSSATGWTVKQPAAPAPRQSDSLVAGMDYGAAVPRDAGSSGQQRGAPSESSWQNRSPMESPYTNGGLDAQQSGGRSPRSQRQPAAYGGDQEGGYGRMPDLAAHAAGNGIGQRRGPPIPSNELPPWLRGTGPHGGGEAYGGQGSMDQADNDMDWDDGAEAAPQWNDWDDEGFGGASGYARQDEFAQYDYDEEPQQEQRGGWRRIFGRK